MKGGSQFSDEKSIFLRKSLFLFRTKYSLPVAQGYKRILFFIYNTFYITYSKKYIK